MNTLVMEARITVIHVNTYEGVEDKIKQALSQIAGLDIDEVTVQCLMSRPEA